MSSFDSYVPATKDVPSRFSLLQNCPAPAAKTTSEPRIYSFQLRKQLPRAKQGHPTPTTGSVPTSIVYCPRPSGLPKSPPASLVISSRPPTSPTSRFEARMSRTSTNKTSSPCSTSLPTITLRLSSPTPAICSLLQRLHPGLARHFRKLDEPSCHHLTPDCAHTNMPAC